MGDVGGKLSPPPAREPHAAPVGALTEKWGPFMIAVGRLPRKGFPEVSRGIVAADARVAAEGLRIAVNDLRVEEEQDRRVPGLVESLAKRNRGMTNKPTMARAPLATCASRTSFRNATLPAGDATPRKYVNWSMARQLRRSIMGAMVWSTVKPEWAGRGGRSRAARSNRPRDRG
jgi:hypothetical protein